MNAPSCRDSPVVTPAPPHEFGTDFDRWELLGRSKVGTVSWRAEAGRRWVKVFRCATERQARLLEWLGEHPLLGDHFPSCVARRGDLIAVDWIEGECLDKRTFRRNRAGIEATARLLARLHAARPAPEFSSDDIYRDYLLRRLIRHERLLNDSAAKERLLALLEPSADRRRLLTHPDLSPQNLVVTSRGHLCSIDNELLGVGPVPEIDLLTPWRYFGRGLRRRRNSRRFLEAYTRSGGRLDGFSNHGETIVALSRLRSLGSHLEEGRSEQAAAEARRILAGRSTDHPLVVMARRLA